MKFCAWVLVMVFLLNGFSVFSQEKYTKHKVSKGETISEIAEQYNVKPSAIYELNPGSKKGIKAKSVLLIPNLNNKKEIASRSSEITHIVLPKETLFGIAKEYKVTLKELYAANPGLEKGTLMPDQKIIIPAKETANQKAIALKEESKSQQPAVIAEKASPEKETIVSVQPLLNDKTAGATVTREVLPKETKYGIAKEYGISVEELERQNPEIVQNLPVGYKLNIRSSKLTESADGMVAGKENSNNEFKSLGNADLIDRLIGKASEHLGTRYRAGGTTKEGFDCSGLMYNTFGAFDIHLPRSSIEQAQLGEKIDTSAAKKGDLIFFKTNRRRHINHVGMVVEVSDGDIKFIHSSTSGGVMISSVKEKYYANSLTQINRVL